MPQVHVGRRPQPFHTRGKPVVFVHYQAQQAADRFLHMILNDPRGLGLFYGPASSGKSSILRQFLRGLPADIAVASVDGTNLKPEQLLRTVLLQFGLRTGSESADDHLVVLRRFLERQSRHSQVPLLVVENFNRMYPSSLRMLCHLATLREQRDFLLRMVLVSTNASYSVIHAPAMNTLSHRLISAFELGPMTPTESARYLHSKLRASGFTQPDRLLPAATCERLHHAAGGWPGIIDGLAQRAIDEKSTGLPELGRTGQPAVPAMPGGSLSRPTVVRYGDRGLRTLVLTFQGRTLQEFEMAESKTLIGRSGLCDLVVSSRFVSKFHALLIRDDDAMHLVDLNSTNGTFVNSRRIESRILRHEDVISLGNHGIKLYSPAYRPEPSVTEQTLADTATMLTLTELRRLKAQAAAEAGPAPIPRQGSPKI